MPEEIQPVGETPTPQADSVTPTASAPKQTFEEWLATQADDVKELYATHTASLRGALEKERAANKKRTDAETKAQQEAEQAKLSEVEKVKKQADSIKAERDQLANELRSLRARDALVVSAEHLKVEFASSQAQRDALEIALRMAEYDDEGNLLKPDELIKAALKDRDYLIKAKAAPAPTGATNATTRGATNGELTTERQDGLKRRYPSLK